jgi:DNA repair protein RadA/Sms
MKKSLKSIFVCQNCGYQTPKWMGRCPDCGEWNRFAEEIQSTGNEPIGTRNNEPPRTINAISLSPTLRYRTGINEFDRTLGGGIVPGSLVLIGGDPGVGKSTIVLQMTGRLSAQGHKSLYLSGEESPQQIKLRAERLAVHSEHLYVATASCIEDVLVQMDELDPDVLIVDSIQTFHTTALPSAPGSVGQVREVSARLMNWAKAKETATFLIGHVTKDGAIAGPKVLEHMVDTVLYFEGDRGHTFRILRSVKNRYGPTNEIGVFEMKDTGLDEINNPSRLFLEERPEGTSGSVVMPCLEGTRPVLVEIQTLVTTSPLGMPRRTAVGVDHNRISLLVAVLDKRLGIALGDQDIFVNVAGGLRVDEPAADLAVISSLVSSFLDKPVDRNTIIFGEVGLAGEIRGVSRPELRIKEAKKLGFNRCLLAKSNHDNVSAVPGVKLSPLHALRDLMDILF